MVFNSARSAARNASRGNLSDEQLRDPSEEASFLDDNGVAMPAGDGECVLSENPADPLYLPCVAVKAAVDQKGLDVRAIRVTNCTNIADIFVIVSGTSDRHVESLSDKIRSALAKEGEHPNGSSGYESSQWVILDYGNLVVHIFYEPTRQHYRFDELWARGTKLLPPASLEREMRMLRTGMYR